MSQDQDYEFKYANYRENDPTKSVANPDQYPTPGYARNLGFVWPDGKMQFLNYSYLVSAEYAADGDTITLTFTSHIIEVKGSNLKSLFNELMAHLPKFIVCTDERYNQTKEGDTAIINEINVTQQ